MAASPRLNRPAYLVSDSLALRRRKSDGPKEERVPVEQFISAELLNMLVNNPNAPQFRGLVRREHKMILPVELARTGASTDIRLWLEKEYFRVYGEINNNGYVEVLSARTNDERARGRRTTQPAPALETVGVGVAEYVSVHVSLEEQVTGRTSYHHTDTHEGDVDVPRDIINQGRDAVRRYVREQFEEGNLDLDRDSGDNEYHDEQDDGSEVDLGNVNVRYEDPTPF